MLADAMPDAARCDVARRFILTMAATLITAAFAGLSLQRDDTPSARQCHSRLRTVARSITDARLFKKISLADFTRRLARMIGPMRATVGAAILRLYRGRAVAQYNATPLRDYFIKAAADALILHYFRSARAASTMLLRLHFARIEHNAHLHYHSGRVLSRRTRAS
jgi:hypothetical protein